MLDILLRECCQIWHECLRESPSILGELQKRTAREEEIELSWGCSSRQASEFARLPATLQITIYDEMRGIFVAGGRVASLASVISWVASLQTCEGQRTAEGVRTDDQGNITSIKFLPIEIPLKPKWLKKYMYSVYNEHGVMQILLFTSCTYLCTKSLLPSIITFKKLDLGDEKTFKVLNFKSTFQRVIIKLCR